MPSSPFWFYPILWYNTHGDTGREKQALCGPLRCKAQDFWQKLDGSRTERARPRAWMEF